MRRYGTGARIPLSAMASGWPKTYPFQTDGNTLRAEAFWEHSWAAGRESLLAVRSLLDAAIEKTERQPTKRPTKIRVEKGE